MGATQFKLRTLRHNDLTMPLNGQDSKYFGKQIEGQKGGPKIKINSRHNTRIHTYTIRDRNTDTYRNRDSGMEITAIINKFLLK